MRQHVDMPTIIEELAGSELRKKMQNLPATADDRQPRAFDIPGTYEYFLSIIRDGNFEGVAARKMGVSKATFDSWMNKGRKGEGVWYTRFYLDVLEAQADAEIELVGMIKKNAKRDFRAALAILRQQHPDRWAPKDNLSVGGAITHQHVIEDRRDNARIINQDSTVRDEMRKLIPSDG